MIHVAVLWLINEHHELLLARRALDKPQDPGVWGPSVTGKLEGNESYRRALLREVEEEFSLKPSDYDPSFLAYKTFAHPDGEPRRFGIYYAPFLRSKTGHIHIDPKEVDTFAWFSVEEITAKLLSSPQELVPSAGDVWTQTFQTLKQRGVL
ncbi:MAG TPA: NUDIX hydrolase [Candidatus Saccharimonadales bacterium]|nr:NUDIX hydrolase [Candidatus Saccharimonadales bacterium]